MFSGEMPSIEKASLSGNDIAALFELMINFSGVDGNTAIVVAGEVVGAFEVDVGWEVVVINKLDSGGTTVFKEVVVNTGGGG